MKKKMKKSLNLLIDCFILSCLFPITIKSWQFYLNPLHSISLLMKIVIVLVILSTTALILTMFIQILKRYLKED